MKVDKTEIINLLDNRIQFRIPIYQRVYSWGIDNCQRLWDDIVRIGEKTHSNQRHFIRSIIYFDENDSPASSIRTNSIIDGQQRLTTISLLIKALSKCIKQYNIDTNFSSDKLEEYGLFNRHGKQDLRFKLQLSKRDNPIFKKILDEKPLTEKERGSELFKNYSFFEKKITMENASLLCQGLDKLLVIDVRLMRNEDDPQLIFETINSTGKELGETDKIRNWVFIDLDLETQNRYYTDFWEPMERSFGRNFPEDFEFFLRQYLALKLRKYVNERKVYTEFIRWRQDKPDRTELIEDIVKFSKYYVNMRYVKEKDEPLKIAFKNLKDISFKPCYSLLMGVYSDFKDGLIDTDEFVDILTIVESHYIRKQICSSGTAGFNKLYPTIHSKIDKENYLESLSKIIIDNESPTAKYFKDNEFKEYFVLKEIKPSLRKYILGQIEHFKTKERVNIDNLSVEHIMPQNKELKDDWQKMIGDNWIEVQDKYLHTIGNLTLTGYNSELSDLPFQDKKTIDGGFDNSPLSINRLLKNVENWNQEAIENRAHQLFEIAQNRWPYPIVKRESKKINLPEIEIQLKSGDYDNRRVFVVRTEHGKYTEVFRKGKFVALWWFSKNPLVEKWDLTDRDFLKKKYQQNVGYDKSHQHVANIVGQFYTFFNKVKVGDIVICNYAKHHLLIGEIIGELYFDSETEKCPYPLRKQVKWILPKMSKSELSETLQKQFSCNLTVFEISKLSLKEEVFTHVISQKTLQ